MAEEEAVVRSEKARKLREVQKYGKKVCMYLCTNTYMHITTCMLYVCTYLLLVWHVRTYMHTYILINLGKINSICFTCFASGVLCGVVQWDGCKATQQNGFLVVHHQNRMARLS